MTSTPYNPETLNTVQLGGSPFYKCGCNDPACVLNGCKKGRTLDPAGEIVEPPNRGEERPAASEAPIPKPVTQNLIA